MLMQLFTYLHIYMGFRRRRVSCKTKNDPGRYPRDYFDDLILPSPVDTSLSDTLHVVSHGKVTKLDETNPYPPLSGLQGRSAGSG